MTSTTRTAALPGTVALQQLPAWQRRAAGRTPLVLTRASSPSARLRACRPLDAAARRAPGRSPPFVPRELPGTPGCRQCSFARRSMTASVR